MKNNSQQWLDWAKELQAIGQNGLTYTKDKFDEERFARLREISVEIMSAYSGLSIEKVQGLFCNESGYQTPKLETRAAIFNGDKILLVRENDGTWALPGGWVDYNQSIKSNAEKEVLEEAGLQVRAVRIIALQDRNLHNLPPYAYGVCKVFVECEAISGSFSPNLETTESRYFGIAELPENMAVEKCTAEQVKMCFAAHNNPAWIVPFE